MPSFKDAVETVGIVIDGSGVVVIALGLIIAATRFAVHTARARSDAYGDSARTSAAASCSASSFSLRPTSSERSRWRPRWRACWCSRSSCSSGRSSAWRSRWSSKASSPGGAHALAARPPSGRSETANRRPIWPPISCSHELIGRTLSGVSGGERRRSHASRDGCSTDNARRPPLPPLRGTTRPGSADRPGSGRDTPALAR